MNIRKLKIALTVDLMNSPASDNPLGFAQTVMKKFNQEAGNFKGCFETDRAQIGDNIEQSSHALLFENCTLDLQVVNDLQHTTQLIQGFNLYETNPV